MKNILVLTYWSYKEGLIQSYTLPYLFIISKYLNGGKIFLVTLEKKELALTDQEVLKKNEFLKKYQIIHFPLDYRPISIIGGVKWIFDILTLSKLVRKNNISFIHSWCTPAGAIGFLLAKLNGLPHIIDSYEPHAEAMTENGTWKKGSLSFRALFYLEKLQSKYASHIIAANIGMKQYAKLKYGVEIGNMYIKPACVDLEKFKPGGKEKMRSRIGINGEITCVYAGKLGGIYLDKEVFDFFKRASIFWKDNFRVLLLTNEDDKIIENWLRESELDDKYITKQYVPFNQINDYLAAADFGITPVKPVPTKRYCTPIKDGEYWATGLPVVITKDISDDSNIIEQNNIGYVLKSLDTSEYDNALKKINSLLKDPFLQTRIRKIAMSERGYYIAQNIYEEIYA